MTPARSFSTLVLGVLSVFLITACGDDDGATDASTVDVPTADVTADTSAMDAPTQDVPAMDSGGEDGGPDASVPMDVGNDVPPPAPGVLYVNVGGESRLAVVDVSADGTMVEREAESLELPRAPGAMAFDAENRRFFIGGRQRVFTVPLDAAGTPTLLGTTMLPGQPVYLSLVGDVLISAYFGDDVVASTDVDGAPPHAFIESIDVDEEPHAAFPVESRVYIPHRNGERISWVDVAADGTFGNLEGVDSDEGVGPRHIDFHPSGEFAYVVNEFADTVSAYRVEDAALVPFGEAVTTLPEGVDGSENTGADIHVHPSGNFLYTSNRGHDSIAILDIAADGSLTHRETVSTEARPREFEVSAAGHFLFGLGQTSGAVQSYVIEADGSLTPSDRLVLGDGLRWGTFLSE